ncbi:hypothetical protein KKE34_00885 [Patescibacteria group bacterium]|nr:hypothetical protein [Patescibacteria group bacterium]
MPKSTLNDQLITHKILDKKLSPFITKSFFIEKLKEEAKKKDLKNHPSRKQFEDMLFKYNTLIAQDHLAINKKVENLEDLVKNARQERKNFKAEMKILRHKTITIMSQVMGELKTIREEISTFGYRQSQNSKQLDIHEDRFIKVETHLGLATI